ncbi:hypothetical protein Q0M94_23005 (plasmid) [Deinococcus radiomollis]|uniref:hypothetical protein n=1 Tax=Deinococcus radiomollis TaxID=468916 RepID=UPI0038923E25
MDAGLKPLELEVVFLEHLARKADAHAFMQLQLRDAELLSELKFRFPRRTLTLESVRETAGVCRALQLKAAAPEVIDGLVSRHIVICSPKHLTGVTAGAKQETFRQLATRLKTHGEEPIAQLVPRELNVSAEPATLTVRNVGLGPRDAVRIVGPAVALPAWLLGSVDDTTLTLQANPAFNGIYRRSLTVQTNAGEVSSTVTLASWKCPPLTQDPVSLRSLATWHADMDEDDMTARITTHLERLGYWSLPGGFFSRGGTSAPRTPSASRHHVTLSWRIEREHLHQGRLPAEGHLPLVRLYSPDGSERYDVQFRDGAFQGEGLEQLLVSWDVKLGSQLSLQPYRGHYQFEVTSGARGPATARSVPDPATTLPPALADYDTYSGPVAHPVLAEPGKVLHSLIEILKVEGPAVGHQLYRRYGDLLAAQNPAAPISRMTLKQVLNRAIYRASSSGVVVAEDEFATGGQIGQVYRLPGQGVRARNKGDRTVSLIPRSELQAVAAETPKPPGATPKQHAEVILRRFGFSPALKSEHDALLPLLKEAPGPASTPSTSRAR